jgi:CDP-glucose 4,6-dehydratase
MQLTFWQGKRVFITGHTGFKGSWLCEILAKAGADVTGYALVPPTDPDLFTLGGIADKITHVIGDIRDKDRLFAAYQQAQPEIVFHLAAQPLVRESYQNPHLTYETNVMGTVNLLECLRLCSGARSFLNVTTDKVYRNNEWEWGYRETDTLDGFDPYSNSKSCSELVTHSYKRAFFASGNVAISTARAGNVIGGGDFAADRLVPDCVRAAMKKETITIRNPHATRPFQHVLEPLFAYLMIAERQYSEAGLAGSYNVGPDESDCLTAGALADLFCAAWGEGLGWVKVHTAEAPHEAGLLKLDCSRLKAVFGWSPRWDIAAAVQKTVEWTKACAGGADAAKMMDKQIAEYMQ